MFEKSSIWLWFLIALALALGISMLLTWGLWNWYMPRMMGMMGYGWWWFMPITAIIFLTLIALITYYLVTALPWQGKREAKNNGSYMQILKERYARGEITKEQFLEMKNELET